MCDFCCEYLTSAKVSYFRFSSLTQALEISIGDFSRSAVSGLDVSRWKGADALEYKCKCFTNGLLVPAVAVERVDAAFECFRNSCCFSAIQFNNHGFLLSRRTSCGVHKNSGCGSPRFRGSNRLTQLPGHIRLLCNPQV